MKIKIMCFITMLLVAAMLGGNNFAANTAAIKSTVTRQSIEKIQANKSLTDIDKVKQIVEAVLTAKIQVENHFTNFDFAFVQNNPDHTNYSLSFFNKKVKLFKEAKKHHNNYKIDIDIHYNFYEIQVSDDKASLRVTQTYKFQYVGDSQPSSMETAFDIRLVKKERKWLIDDIRSNEIFERVYYKTDFDYSAKLEEMTTPEKTLTQEEEDMLTTDREMMLKELSLLPIIEYDTGAAVSYAYRYYSNYNIPAFPDFNDSGGDCQNFASQCVSAGFGDRMQMDGNGSWFCIRDAQGFYLFDPGWRWTFSLAFNDYINTSTTAQPGLFGYIPPNHSLLYTKVGDVIHGPGETGEYQHAVFVTGTTGIDGQQTMDTIKVTGHSPNMIDAKLSDVFYYGAACKDCQIVGWVKEDASQ